MVYRNLDFDKPRLEGENVCTYIKSDFQVIEFAHVLFQLLDGVLDLIYARRFSLNSLSKSFQPLEVPDEDGLD